MSNEIKIPHSEFKERVKRTQRILIDKGFEGLVAISSYCEREGNVCYLTNHHTSFPPINDDESVMGWGNSAVVLALNGGPILIAPLFYREDMIVGVEEVKTDKNLPKMIAEAIISKGLKGRIALIGSDIIPLSIYRELNRLLPQVKFEPADEILINQRMIKSDSEIKLMREACRIADLALEECMKAVKPGVSENELGIIARKVALEAGADYIVRDRVYSGPWAGKQRWPFTTNRKVKDGELVYVDLVGWYKNYAFDMLRTRVAGRMSKDQAHLIKIAQQCTDYMINLLRPGVSVKQIYLKVAEFMSEMKIQGGPSGHGMGIEVVEKPIFHQNNDTILKPAMILCIEPKATIPNIGTARFEEEVLITESGFEILSHCPRDY